MSTTITGDAAALSVLAQAGICELSVATGDSHSVQAVFWGGPGLSGVICATSRITLGKPICP
jgi:hypothetical protein